MAVEAVDIDCKTVLGTAVYEIWKDGLGLLAIFMTAQEMKLISGRYAMKLYRVLHPRAVE